ncbi:MFS transporter, partial [Bacillus subtilis]|uniref:MFS transporter n=1 Tax=Bacillus subtilis TaxID=1423 RepID=UPI00092C3444
MPCRVGFKTGCLIVGPRTVAWGRRAPLLIGIFLLELSSLVCSLSPIITTLVAARCLQGFTSSAGVVLSRAIVRDVFTGRELSTFFSLLMVLTAVAPMVAPMTGGAVLPLPFATWNTIFHVLMIIGFFLVLLSVFGVNETIPPETRTPCSIVTSVKTSARRRHA